MTNQTYYRQWFHIVGPDGTLAYEGYDLEQARELLDSEGGYQGGSRLDVVTYEEIQELEEGPIA